MKFLWMLILILFSWNTINSQSNVIADFEIDISLEKENSIQKNNYYPMAYLVGTNYCLDKNKNIYLAKTLNKQLLYYNYSNNSTSQINLPKEVLNSNQITNIVPAVSTKDDLYVLIRTNEEVFIALYFFDGQKFQEIKLEYPIQGRVKMFYLNTEDEFCFATFPHVLNPSTVLDDLIYLYNSDGKFLGKTNFPFKTNDYLVRVQSSNEKLTIIAKPKKENIRETIEVDIYNKKPEAGIIALLGTDLYNNTYIFNNDEIIIHNLVNGDQKKIGLKVEEGFINNLITGFRYIKVSPEGDLYLLGLNSDKSKIKPGDRVSNSVLMYTISEVK